MTPKETTSTSAAAPTTRAGVKPKPKCKACEAKKGCAAHGSVPGLTQKQSAKFNFIGHFKETGTDVSTPSVPGQKPSLPGSRFRVTLLQEGLGNLDDCYYYGSQAITSAAKIYEGKKIFVDHPSKTGEVDLPERSVKDILGYFENVAAEQAADGRFSLMGDLVTLQDPSLSQYRALMLESLAFSEKHPGQELVGLSINASGDFDTVPVEQFLKSGNIPESCLEKIQEAVSRGITMIRPVTEMKSAVSCDLVTTAGAGGKINQLLEGEKKRKAMNEKDKEAAEKKAKEAAEKEKEAKKEAAGPDAGAPGDPSDDEPGVDGQDGDHPDAEQDEKLIMDMLTKYLGNGFSDQDKQLMAQHHQAAMEMGLEGKEAEEVAGHSMKMAKHMMSKQQPAPGADPQAPAQESGDGTPGSDAGIKVKPSSSVTASSPSRKDQVQESSKGKPGMTELVGKVAKLEAELATMRLKESADKALRESGLPMKATKKFRESILPTIKSEADLTKEVSKFKEAYALGGEATEPGFMLGAEKSNDVGGGESGSLDFSDCVES